MIDAVFGYAPGKIILFGEHAVVYGQPAIAATIDRGIRVAVTTRTTSASGDGAHLGPVLRSHSLLGQGGRGQGHASRARPDSGEGRADGEGPERLRKALAVLVELCGERTRDLLFSVDGAIPVGAGLGSSAALAVAMIRGVHRFFDDPPLSVDELVERAFALERVFHGNPSGVDHSVIARGGCFRYQRDPSSTLAVVDRTKLARRLRLAVAIAGSHAGTAHAVGALRERSRRHPAHYAHLYEGIGELAQAALVHLQEGALGAVGELMDLNQGYLNALGVSTPAVEALCAIARERGALGAKLSGAGGGGAVIALVDDDPTPIVRAFEAAGYQSFATDIESPSSAEAAPVQTQEIS